MFKLCPPEIQYILLAHLENYFAHKHPMFADFWEMSDGALAMEISREACLLPMEWVDTCKVRASLMRRERCGFCFVSCERLVLSSSLFGAMRCL